MSKAKIVGFNRKLSKKFRTVANWANDPIFINACKETATKLGVKQSTLLTKRQASKFINGRGVVIKTIFERSNHEKQK